jgi:hypothetical protein|tara:strand:- start:95 stop:1120 length:1026 start_codon:yes stop_codon:yes gene_type:complete
MSVGKGVKSAAKLPTGVAKPKKSPETQALSDCLDYSTLIKADGSHIYTRKLPGENGKKTLRIDGPGDSAVALDSEGTIRLITGIHDPNRGAASGKLLIKTQGQQQMHKEPSVIQYNAGGENKEALNVLCYGDVVTEARGSEYTVRATKITFIADEELTLMGQGGVKIQAGQSGKGTIDMVCGSLNQRTVNYKEVITGQKKTEGVSEESVVQFDPRASVNIVSAGSINHKIIGDMQQQVGGAFHMDILGKKIPGGLLTGDGVLNAYQLRTVAGKTEITTVDLDLTSAKTTVETADLDLTSAKTTLKTADLDIAAAKVDIVGTADVSITGANVRITGALIYLN